MQIENWHKMSNQVDHYSSHKGLNSKRGGKIMDKGYFMLRVTNINRATKISLRQHLIVLMKHYSERTDEKLSFEIILLSLKP